MRHVTLSLSDGSIIKGYIPPPFWVVRGTYKISCPQNEDTHLAIILDPYWKKYRPHFDNGEKLFDEFPQGYVEALLSQIQQIEMQSDLGYFDMDGNTVPIPRNRV